MATVHTHQLVLHALTSSNIWDDLLIAELIFAILFIMLYPGLAEFGM
jgi:hypothetical protein